MSQEAIQWNSKPVRSAKWTQHESTGFTVILKPKFSARWMKYLKPLLIRGDHFKIKLDAVGTAIWNRCDGEHTLRQIAEALDAEFGKDVDPVDDRLSQFIIQLTRSKFIDFGAPQQSPLL